MKVLKGNYGECRFVDNMDPDHGLPSLAEKSWDLCLTDPPYNVDFNPKLQNNLSVRRNRKDEALHKHKEDLTYIDIIPDYKEWSIKWFELSSLICNDRVIFTPGNQNLKLWLNIKEPTELHFHYKKNGFSCMHYTHFNRYEIILLYGKYTPWGFYENVHNIPLENGFLNKEDYIHTSPKPRQLWERFIKQSKATSVLDPFLGSGTTAEVCETLGIPWLGYEIMEDYAPDIEKRIRRGIKKHGQQTISEFF